MNRLNHKIIFWGTPEFAVPSLDTLNNLGLVSVVITQPDRPAGRGQKYLPSPVKQAAIKHNIDILDPDSLDNNFVESLQKYLPATFVAVAYGKIIPQPLLDLSEKTAVNIHPSKLPILRGPSPIQTAILEGFKSTGVSLMQLDKKMDHGPILSQIQAKIEPNDDYLSLSQRLSQLGADLLANNILDYLADKITPLAQDDSHATYCQLIEKSDGQIDWSKPAQDIHNQVRAYSFWPQAWAQLNGLDLKILKTEIVDKNLEAGQVEFNKENIIVGTGDRSIKILQVQPAGKKIMSASEFVRGYQKYLNNKFN